MEVIEYVFVKRRGEFVAIVGAVCGVYVCVKEV